MLLLRLKNYYLIVDKFLIIEGNKTFTNLEKEKLFINDIKTDDRFSKYLSNIEFLICDITNETCWENEKKCRNKLFESKIFNTSENNTIFLHGDCDEILRPFTLQKIKDKNIINKTFLFKNIMFSLKWEYLKNIKDIHDIRIKFRNNNNYHYSDEIGWHFSFIGDLEFIKRKINSFSHQEMNRTEYNNDEYIFNEIIKKGNVIDFFTVSWNKGKVPNLIRNNINDLPNHIKLIDYFNIL